MSFLYPILTAMVLVPSSAQAEDCRADPSKFDRELRPIRSPRIRNRYEMSEVRIFEGVWVNEFEGSKFIEGVRGAEDALASEARVWLHIDGQTVRPSGFIPETRRAYRLKIQACIAPEREGSGGRQGGYGHFGQSTGFIAVNEIIEFEDLGPIER